MFDEIKFKGLYARINDEQRGNPMCRIGKVWVSYKGVLQCEIPRITPWKELYSQDGLNVLAQVWLEPAQGSEKKQPDYDCGQSIT